MMYRDRPKLKLLLTTTDKALEIIGLCTLLALWTLVILNYTKLPDTIPIHYNASGEIDGYGNKSMIWNILLIGSIIYAGMTLLNRFPHIFNYTTKITAQNALREYTIATKIVRCTKLIILLMFGYLILKIINSL